MQQTSPELLYSLLCEGVIVGGDGKAAIFGTFTNINSVSFPVVFPKFTIFNGWLGKKGSFTQTTKVVAPSGSEVARATVSVDIQEDDRIANVIHDFRNVRFDAPGTYWVQVVVGEDLVRKYPLTLTPHRHTQPNKPALA